MLQGCKRSLTSLQVVVTGAAGQTGSLIVEKLLARPDEFITRAVVRSAKVGAEVIFTDMLAVLSSARP